MQVAEELESMDARKLATAMACCFWGTLLVVIDVTYNRFDVLPDLLGWLLVATGLMLVLRSDANGVARGLLQFCLVVSVVALLAELLPVRGNGVVRWALSLLYASAALAFCVAMRRRTGAAEWPSARRLWEIARGWVLWVWCVPLALSIVVSAARLRSFAVDSSVPGVAMVVVLVLLVLLLLAPMVLMLVGMSRTGRAAREAEFRARLRHAHDGGT